MCLSLYFALRHYFLSTTVLVIARTDLIKYMLTRPGENWEVDPRAIRVHFSVRSYEGGQRTGICRLLGRSCHEPVELDEEVLAFAEVDSLLRWI